MTSCIDHYSRAVVAPEKWVLRQRPYLSPCPNQQRIKDFRIRAHRGQLGFRISNPIDTSIHSTMAKAESKSVLVPVANGSEEIEAVTIIDTLRRAGANVTVASVEADLQVEMSRKVKLVADKLIIELKGQQFDLIALPGGMPGSERLRDSSALKELLEQQQASDRFVTAICAAPAVVLEAQGLLKGKKATSHPGFTDKLSDKSHAETRVVVDGKTVTSRGPGTSLEFALSLVSQLYGKQKADEVAGPMVISKGLEY